MARSSASVDGKSIEIAYVHGAAVRVANSALRGNTSIPVKISANLTENIECDLDVPVGCTRPERTNTVERPATIGDFRSNGGYLRERNKLCGSYDDSTGQRKPFHEGRWWDRKHPVRSILQGGGL